MTGKLAKATPADVIDVHSPSAVARLSKRVEPCIRRGAMGDADTVRLFAIEADDEAELWSAELRGDTDSEVLTAECVGVILDEDAGGESTQFRVRCYSGDEPTSAGVTVRTRAPRRAEDMGGDALLPQRESVDRALTRQAMRHAEGYARMSLGSIERREGALVATVESLTKALADSQQRERELHKELAESRARDREYELQLLRTSAFVDAAKDLTGMVKEVGPRIVQHLSGEGLLHPLVGIIAKVTPEQVRLMTSAGVLTESDAKVLTKAADKARKAVNEGKGDKANGKGGHVS